ADCAARALPVYEAACPGDDRARRAVEVARAYARGEATRGQLAAGGMAARAAAGDAVRAAADAADAAWVAARAAARAAEAAAGAAEAAERRWQAARLAELLGIDPPREEVTS